ncbi:MAG: hydantoinase/oxoprolinase family protein [Deltaproteobacteria bacterium]
MLIGIDVGGTYTDGVIFDQGEIKASTKAPTDSEDIKGSVLAVLDGLLGPGSTHDVQRIVLGTTLVTNILATGRGEPTALILLPGYGLPHDAYNISRYTWYLKGAVDFRGREIEPLDRKELTDTVEAIINMGLKRVAVAAKFANRNNRLELEIRDYIQGKYPEIKVSISSEVSGKLNFPRRAVTTYFTAMTLTEWNHFADEIESALQQRGINIQVDILKADGGTVSMASSRIMPCETVFSGPAASTMGALALDNEKVNSVVIDVGGTTSDISLIIDGNPLYSARGAMIEDHLTQVNAFAVRSLALGGDSPIIIENDIPGIAGIRQGPAACFGGKVPTVTDVFNVKYQLDIGDAQASREKLTRIAAEHGLDLDDINGKIVETVTDRLTQAIREMFGQWEKEPAYKVWEVIHRRRFELHRIIGIGAAAEAILPPLAERLGVPLFLHRYSAVANALGASVVRPTLSVQVHVDTAANICTVDPGGIQAPLINGARTQLEDVKAMACKYLVSIGSERGMGEYTGEYKFYMEEQFNTIRGYSGSGKLFDVGVQVLPGFINEFKGVRS